MRALIYSLIFTLLLIIFGIYINNGIYEFTDNYTSEVIKIESFIKEDDWDSAKYELDKYSKSFDKDKNPWYKVLDHEYFLDISCYIDILDSSIYLENKNLGLEQIEKIKSTLGDIYQNEKCDWNNIF